VIKKYGMFGCYVLNGSDIALTCRMNFVTRVVSWLGCYSTWFGWHAY
jgi:hypothetical protein